MSRRWVFAPLAERAFGVILADPPWRFQTFAEGSPKAPEAHYATMTTEEIAALPVDRLAAPDCALFMWATAPMLLHGLGVMAAWGFSYKSFTCWGKLARGADASDPQAKLAFGTGYIFRSAAEICLVGTRGKPRPVSRSVRNLILAPAREHSRKPDQLHADIEALYPRTQRVELFARARRPGWDCWGNQVSRFGGSA